MIEVGKEYIFNYKMKCKNESEDDVEVCINSDGLSCRVLERRFVDDDGFCMYEVESCTGSQFFAFESELGELNR